MFITGVCMSGAPGCLRRSRTGCGCAESMRNCMCVRGGGERSEETLQLTVEIELFPAGNAEHFVREKESSGMRN